MESHDACMGRTTRSSDHVCADGSSSECAGEFSLMYVCGGDVIHFPKYFECALGRDCDRVLEPARSVC